MERAAPLLSGAVVGIVILAVLVVVTLKGWWPYLWREWLTSVDHKRIGVMYLVLGLVMLLRGYTDAIMMRTQQAIAIGGAQELPPGTTTRSSRPRHDHDLFRGDAARHRLMNLAVPLQLGVRDVAFPVLNSISFWLTAAGALLINVSLVIGNFARTGWMATHRSRTRLFARCRRRLLPLVIADLGHRHVADRHQFRDHDSQIARPGHDLFPHAGVLLDRTVQIC